MLATLTIVLPVFAVILLGYGVGKTRVFSEEGVRALSNFCFMVAIPALLFRAMAKLETPEGFDFAIVAAFYAAVLVAYGIAMLAARLAFRELLIARVAAAVIATTGIAWIIAAALLMWLMPTVG